MAILLYKRTGESMEKFVFKNALLLLIISLSACAGPDMRAGRQAYMDKDYATAHEHYYQLAEFGIPEAKTELGKMYLYGQGVAPDPERALQLFTEAEAMGDKRASTLIPKAQKKLAVRKIKSSDRTQGMEGLNLLKEAAASTNDPHSLIELGRLYEEGRVVDKNGRIAEIYYRKAANYNSAKAYYHLGRLYHKGPLVQRDLEKAALYYKQAGEKGYKPGYKEAAAIYENPRPISRPFQQAYLVEDIKER
jgi:uncharacterized protein